ncbi:MAG: trimethylamine--corrinoid protein Co-methyltransferase, partial [Acidimicrobiales bacterium]
EAWEEAGSPTADEKAATLYKQLLIEYQQPSFEADRLAAVNEFVDRRIAEGGVETDF